MSRSANGTYEVDQLALLGDALPVPEEALCAVPQPLCHVAHPPNRALSEGV
jgi:hypothetical protein